MNKKNFSHFGYSTILLAFAMICIITFSVLSFATANSDYKLSKRVASKTTAYYQAEEKIYDAIDSLDDQLLLIYDQATDSEDYISRVDNLLSDMDGSYEKYDNYLLYSMQETISDTQTLEVKLKISYPYNKGQAFYTISQWKTITDTSVEEDDTLNLIGGN